MIDRLNFFDVYGHLIPGSVFLLAVCLPYAVLDPRLLSIELGSGLIAIMVAYVTGFHIYGLAELTLASRMPFDGRLQHYSMFILDDRDPTKTFGSSERRQEIRDAIAGYFPKARGKEAQYFIPARAVLLHKKLATYVEQAQGMYVMARGICLASALGACYLIGWSIVALPPTWRLPRAPVALLAALCGGGGIFGCLTLSWLKSDVGSPIPRRLVRLFRLAKADDRRVLESRAAWSVVFCLAAFLLAVAVWRAQPVTETHVAPAIGVALCVSVLVALRSYASWTLCCWIQRSAVQSGSICAASAVCTRT